VAEEFTRFILNDRALTSQLKNIRHKLELILAGLAVDRYRLIAQRNSPKDVGKAIVARETRRSSYADIVFANIGRVKESIRALEEFSKLIDKKAALRFKNIRYAIYDIEKKIVKKIVTLRNLK
jgi:thiamine-phosphate pyrophosphorylase